MPQTHFIDLSHHNSNKLMDVEVFKANELVGVIHKATEGTTYTDTTYLSRRSYAMAHDIPWASYHFLKGGNVDSQMAHFLDVVQPCQGERLVIDHEANATLDELESAVLYLKQQRPDLQITVYSGHLIKDQLGERKSDVLALYTSLWVAQYNNTGPSWPQGTWSTWSAWQWSDKGQLIGVTDPVDVNEFNGSREQCLAWFGPVADDEVPFEDQEDDLLEINIDIDSPPGVIIRVNGQEI